MHTKLTGLVLLGAISLSACQENVAPMDDSNTAGPSLAKAAAPLTGTPVERAAQIAARVNARLEAAGSTVRLDDAFFFTSGQGTPDYRRLRTGSRWVNPRNVSYSIDLSDLVSAPNTEAALVQAHEAFNNVPNIVLRSTRVADDGKNNDILDGMIRNAAGVCVDVVDLAEDNAVLQDYDPATGELTFEPVTDNLFGGWLDAEYFLDCLGSANILGVTWSFSDVDGALTGETDGYRDRIYTEQYYNRRFTWVTSGSVFLGDEGEDIESIVLHEVGHTHGLGHFGGPNPNQPFKLQPNGRVFDPEAVMNPFYLGGEKRSLLPTDLAALKALYASKRLN